MSEEEKEMAYLAQMTEKVIEFIERIHPTIYENNDLHLTYPQVAFANAIASISMTLFCKHLSFVKKEHRKQHVKNFINEVITHLQQYDARKK